MSAAVKTTSRLRELFGAEPLSGPGCGLLEKRIDDQHEPIVLLARSLATAQQSPIRRQEQIVVQQGAIETLANMVGAEQVEHSNGLVGFEKPRLIAN